MPGLGVTEKWHDRIPAEQRRKAHVRGGEPEGACGKATRSSPIRIGSPIDNPVHKSSPAMGLATGVKDEARVFTPKSILALDRSAPRHRQMGSYSILLRISLDAVMVRN